MQKIKNPKKKSKKKIQKNPPKKSKKMRGFGLGVSGPRGCLVLGRCVSGPGGCVSGPRGCLVLGVCVWSQEGVSGLGVSDPRGVCVWSQGGVCLVPGGCVSGPRGCLVWGVSGIRMGVSALGCVCVSGPGGVSGLGGVFSQGVCLVQRVSAQGVCLLPGGVVWYPSMH